MRLGTILGGKSWGELNRSVKDKERAAKKLQRETEKKRGRRAELESMGFKPIGEKR